MHTDFLSHLSARATQATASEPAASGLQPRPVSLFEPPRPSIFPVFDRSPDSGEVDDAPFRADSRPGPVPPTLPRTLGPLPSIWSSLADETPRQPRPQGERVQVTVIHEREFLSPKAESVQVAASAPCQSDNPPDVALPEIDKSLRSQDNLSQAAALRPGAVTPSLIGEQAEVRERKAEADASAARQTDQPVRLDSTPVPTSKFTEKPKIVPEKVAIAPKAIQPAKPEPRPQPDSVPEPPTINVTIGRIEVKATTPPAPSMRAPTASPVMSLDEYLRRRRGGSE